MADANYNAIVITTVITFMIFCFGVMYWITCERIMKLGTTDFRDIRATLSKNLFGVLICSTLVISVCNTMLHGILYGDAKAEEIAAAAATSAERTAALAEEVATKATQTDEANSTEATKNAVTETRTIANAMKADAKAARKNADKVTIQSTLSTFKRSLAYCVPLLLSTFIMIGLFPSLNDIFENSLGQFIVTSSPLWNYANIIKAFKHGKKDATQTALVVEAPDIPMDYVMSMFNIRNVREQLVDINESPEYHDFHVEMDGFCTQTGDSTDNNTNFERDLFSMCLAKYCIGHFAWVSISSAVAMSLI